MNGILQTINELANSWLVVPLLSLFSFLDGFFPPLPSESLIISIASLSHSTPTVSLWFVFIFCALGASAGDSVAYLIGRYLPVEKIPLIRRFATPEAIKKARHSFDRRGASYLLGARFVPVGRIAINIAAGNVRFPYLRFLAIDMVGSLMWAGVSLSIGLGTGAFLKGHPLLSICIGIAIGIAFGYVLDKILTLIKRRLAARGYEFARED
ncbi:DedA family protein [Actinomycetaceae bacterium TAE3-ERU4]|nr:DedA family protein [Actinomycetaceae bacterium TAE3-ERU4]